MLQPPIGLVALLARLVALLAGLIALLARLVTLLSGQVAFVANPTQVLLQIQDLGRGGQTVALVEQLAHPGSALELPARVAPMPAGRAVRANHTSGVEATQEGLLHTKQLGGPTDGEGRIVLVVEPSDAHVVNGHLVTFLALS